MIITLDIAFKNTGWAAIHDGKIVEFGTIRTTKTKKKGTLVSDDRASRAMHLAEELHTIINKHKPSGIVGELPSGSQNATAANLLGWAGGVVIGVATCHNLPCEWISEGDSKLAALGKRSATKEDCMAWTAKAYPHIEFPKAKCHFEHVSDALLAHNGLRSGVLVRSFG